MCLTSAAVYFFTSALNYQVFKKTANEMNQKLKEYHEKKADLPSILLEESKDEKDE